MVDVRIERRLELPAAHLASLIAESEQAGRLDETLGFRPRAGDPGCTHVMEIAAVP